MSESPTLKPSTSSPLLKKASQAVFWNTALLPILALLQLIFAVVIRRQFGLGSGAYDVLVGLMATLLLHSSVGIPVSLLKFLPEIVHSSGFPGLQRLFRDTLLIRLSLLCLLLSLLNLYADTIGVVLGLGHSGGTYLRLISVIALARATIDMMVRALNAFFAQKWSNIIQLAQVTLELTFVGVALLLGYEMNGVFGGLLSAALVVAFLSIGLTHGSWDA